jgi:hypothetical protein
MATETISALLSNMDNYKFNPALIQQDMFSHLNYVTNGDVTIVDPSNPFVFAMEAACVLTAGFMAQDEVLTRRQYPSLAQTVDDLYYHMSDKDYINRFASPSKVAVQFIFSETELAALLVEDTSTGIYKIVIPRNTYVTVGGATFSLQYPIEIRQMPHGGWQVVYDTTTVSPLQTLSTNVIDWKLVNNNDVTWMWFEVDMYQFDIITQTESVTAASAVNVNVSLTSGMQYYYCRVWYQDTTTSEWVEMATTHNPRVYDPLTLTAVLQLDSGTLNVTIPEIYITQSLLSSHIRIDVYETQGNITLDLSVYDQSSFVTTFYWVDTNDSTIYVAPLTKLKTYNAFSDGITNGGTDALSFSDLRTQVITNAIGSPSLPITNVQLATAAQENGFNIVANVDNITNRRFLATRLLPAPTEDTLITAANASIETLVTTMAAATKLASVVDNDTSITITPDTLFLDKNGSISLVQTAVVKALLAMTPENRAIAVTGAGYYYTPWHYVVDMSGSELDVRPYYLDGPTAGPKVFVGENDTTLLTVSADTYGISRTDTGYKLTVTTTSNTAFQALKDDTIYVQLAYIPYGETTYAYLNGVFQGATGTTGASERIYTFDLLTNFNVTSDDNLQLSKFTMTDTTVRTTDCPLTQTFELLWATSATLSSTYTSDTIDNYLGKYLLPTNIKGVTHEQLTIVFGQSLDALWSTSRTTASSVTYETYSVNVPNYWKEDVYKVQDTATGSIIGFNSDGSILMEKLHSIGDPVLDSNGNQTYLHLAGDTVLDASTGLPVAASVRGLEQQIDLMLIDAVYWFATDSTAVSYRSELIKTYLSWIVTDLPEIQSYCLEETEIYFHPQATQGQIAVLPAGGVQQEIDAAQSFVANLYVSKSVYNNSSLTSKLSSTTISTLATALQSETVSMSSIIDTLSGLYGSDVISFSISGLGGSSNDFNAVTVVNGETRLSLAKRLTAQADNTLIVEEAVTVNFIIYKPSTTSVS